MELQGQRGRRPTNLIKEDMQRDVVTQEDLSPSNVNIELNLYLYINIPVQCLIT